MLALSNLALVALAGLYFLCICGCSSGGSGRPNKTESSSYADSLQTIINRCVVQRDYTNSLKYAYKLKALGERTSNEDARLSGMVYLGQNYLCLGQIDSMTAYLDSSLELGRARQNHWAVATINNALGVYALFNLMDYSKAIEYLSEGLKHAELCHEEKRLVVLKSNLSLAYYLRKDSAGLKYALDVYQQGKREKDAYMIFSGALTSSYMYYLLKDYDRAMKYIRETLPMADTYGDAREVYTLYGDVQLAMGHDDEAVENYRKALTMETSEYHFSGTEIHLSYGKYLIGKKNYQEAINILRQGLESALRRGNSVNRYQLYFQLSTACEAMGNTNAAFRYYKSFHEEVDSIFNIHKERAISELRIRYEKEKYENTIQQSRIAILKGEKQLQFALLSLAVMLVAMVAGILLYHRRNRHFKQILIRNQEMLDKERWYQQQMQELSGNNTTEVQYVKRNISDERAEELFERLQKLMRTEKLYRTHELSREKVATQLETNRTYLTEVIGKYTGLTFNYYINSFRIDEAISILSDTTNEIPIKALSDEVGFSSMSTFYKFFNDIKGMPPSQFREMCAQREKPKNPTS